MGLFALGFEFGVGWYNMVPRLPDFVCLGFRMLDELFCGLGVVGRCGLVSLVGLFAV